MFMGSFSTQKQPFLFKASKILASSLDYAKTLTSIAKLAVPKTADWCIVHIVGGKGEVIRLAIAHTDPKKVRLARNMELGAAKAIRTGKPQLFRKVSEEDLKKISRDKNHLKILQKLGPRSALIVPLKVHKKVFGAMSFVTSETEKYYDAHDLSFAQELARIAALAIEGARLHQEIKDSRDEIKKSHQELEGLVKKRTAQLGRINRSLQKEIEVRKKIEIRLDDEKKKLEAIYKTVSEGLALYDRAGRVVYMNPSLEKLFGVKQNLIGVKREEIVKKREWYFKYYLERYDDSLKTQKDVYSGKVVTNVMMKIYSKSPKYLEANYIPIKDSKGGVVGMSASFRDVTTLKNQAEHINRQLLEVEKQKNRLQAVFENVEEGVYVFDKNLKMIQANDACELMTGCSEKEMVGKSYYDIFGCHDRVGHYYPEFNPVSKVLSTRESVPYDEHLHKSKDGKSRWVGVSYTPIFNDKGEIEQIVSVTRDITAIKELEKAKSEFVSVASHELRTPLTVINGYLSLLLSGDLGSLENEKAQNTFLSVLAKVHLETQRLTKLVEELLNVSRIEEGNLKLIFRKLPVVDILEQTTDEFKPIAAMKGIRLKLENKVKENGRNVYISGDPGKFKQILFNLLDNAVKFTESGGEIVTECVSKSGRLYISVRDTGVGIPQSMLPRVFEKFQQVSGSYLKENKGTGLGLFIVKSLVELHKGKIWVRSTPGKGTEFKLELPIVAAS